MMLKCFKYAQVTRVKAWGKQTHTPLPTYQTRRVYSSDWERSHVIAPQTWQPEIDESLTWHTELWKYAVEEERQANQEPETLLLL